MILSVEIERKAFPASGGGEKIVLANLRFSLAEREIVAVVGPSGCGKTTLLKLIGGLDTDFRGRVDWSGGRAPRIGTVFQEPRLLPWRTVRQNLLLAQQTENPQLADALLHTLDLTQFGDAFPATLSLGMARRVAIARAFAIKPALLLLDEPFVSLDAPLALAMQQELAALVAERAVTTVLVTHDVSEAVRLADRIFVLSHRPARVIGAIRVESPRERMSADEAKSLEARIEAFHG